MQSGEGMGRRYAWSGTVGREIQLIATGRRAATHQELASADTHVGQLQRGPAQVSQNILLGVAAEGGQRADGERYRDRGRLHQENRSRRAIDQKRAGAVNGRRKGQRFRGRFGRQKHVGGTQPFVSASIGLR